MLNVIKLIIATIFICSGSIWAAIEVNLPPPSGGEHQNMASGIAVPDPSSAALAQGSTAKLSISDEEIIFANKDQLHGMLLGVDPEKDVLTWQYPGAKRNLEFSLAGIDEVKLERGEQAQNAEQMPSYVWLTNNDVLIGRLLSIDEKNVYLETDYAGRINIPRPMVKVISPVSKISIALYEGPYDLAKWGTNLDQRGWKLQDNMLVATAATAIGRRIDDLPDQVSISFDLEWVNHLNCYFSFFSDNALSYNGNCYTLRFSGNSVNLYGYSSTGHGNRSLGSVAIPSLSNGKMRVTLYVSKKKKEFILVVNDELIKKWVDRQSFIGGGDNIVLHPRSSNSGIKFGKISIAEWDGTEPQNGESSVEVRKTKDLVKLANEDKVSGTVQTLADGQLVFRTSFADMTIPVERISQIIFSSDGSEQARLNKNDIRCIFQGRGAVTLDLSQIAEGSVVGSSDNFGTVSIPLNVFKSLKFNLYKK